MIDYKINYKGKNLVINVKKVSFFGMVKGLMFTKKEDAKALLLFDLEKPKKLKIHSFFCTKFLAIWLGKDNSVQEMRVINPWNPLVLPKKHFYKLIEIPFNNKYKRIIEILVGEGKI